MHFFQFFQVFPNVLKHILKNWWKILKNLEEIFLVVGPGPPLKSTHDLLYFDYGDSGDFEKKD